jgi:hypothetical protein
MAAVARVDFVPGFLLDYIATRKFTGRTQVNRRRELTSLRTFPRVPFGKALSNPGRDNRGHRLSFTSLTGVRNDFGGQSIHDRVDVRNLDFTSWPALLSTLLGLSVITLIGVGIRLLAMQTIQQRRERENRQINERLRTLIAAYKTLGGSFTGDLAVDPVHLREFRRDAAGATGHRTEERADRVRPGSDRSRRIRDAVESSLSDVILLGTEEQVRLAAAAAAELAAGRPVETAALVVSLRDFIRAVLDLQPVPSHVSIPKQGPARTTPSKGGKEGEKDGAKQSGGGMGGGAGGAGLGGGFGHDEETDHHE